MAPASELLADRLAGAFANDPPTARACISACDSAVTLTVWAVTVDESISLVIEYPERVPTSLSATEAPIDSEREPSPPPLPQAMDTAPAWENTPMPLSLASSDSAPPA